MECVSGGESRVGRKWWGKLVECESEASVECVSGAKVEWGESGVCKWGESGVCRWGVSGWGERSVRE